jgi:hypothetical protein
MATREAVYVAFGRAAEVAQLLETEIGTALLALDALETERWAPHRSAPLNVRVERPFRLSRNFRLGSIATACRKGVPAFRNSRWRRHFPVQRRPFVSVVAGARRT